MSISYHALAEEPDKRSALDGHTETVRELDRRTNDGLDVTLFWHPQTNRVSVAVEDHRFGDSFELEVDPAEALDAFHHPYASGTRPARSLTTSTR